MIFSKTEYFIKNIDYQISGIVFAIGSINLKPFSSTSLDDFKKIEYVFKESSELKKVIKSPLVNSEEKLNILLKIFSQTTMNQLTTTFLKVLDNNKRIPNLLTTILQFKKINSEKIFNKLVEIIN